MIRTFRVKIERSVDTACLRWPEPWETVDDSGLGLNRAYIDLRGFCWRDVLEMLQAEEDLLGRYESTEGLPENRKDRTENGNGDQCSSCLPMIDTGVAAVVAALSAARCIPCTSCNGGALGDGHQECYPLVAFHARPQHIPLLLVAADACGVGLANVEGGALIVYTGDLRQMLAFAREVWALRKEFRELRFREHRGAKAVRAKQTKSGTLPFEEFGL